MNKQIKTAAIFLTVICAVVVGCHKVPQKQPADKTSSIASNEEYTSISLLSIFPQKTSSDIVGRGLMRHNKELVNKYQVRVFSSLFFCLPFGIFSFWFFNTLVLDIFFYRFNVCSSCSRNKVTV